MNEETEIDDTGNPIAEAIDGAEEIRDPLDDLVEKTTADPGAAFAPDVLERLAALKREDRAAFETLRARLKEFRVSGNGARRGHRRRKRRSGRARTIAG